MTSNNEPFRQMLDCFQTNDLQNLLGMFGFNKNGRKSELKERALELLHRPLTLNIQSYVAKISEMYHNIQARKPNNMMNRRVQDNTERHIFSQVSQSTIHIPRPGLPQVMPQIPRGIYGNNNNHNANRRIISRGPTNPAVNIVPADLRRYNIALPNIAITTQPPPPQSLVNIKFKKLPFFELVSELILPTNLIGQERCSLQNVPIGMREATYKFRLLGEHATLIGMNRDISNPSKIEYNYVVQIRICLLDPGATELTDFLPLGLHVRVGNKACQLPKSPPNVRPGTEARRILKPIHITHGIKINPCIDNTIIVNWVPDGKNYVFGVSLLKKLNSDILMKRLMGKRARSSKETKNYIIKKLADVDPDLATTSYRVSLMCPLGKMRMITPAKSVNCDHLQCFDAGTFILMNERKPTWLCPTCNKPCAYDDIQIENYFLKIVTSPNLSADSKEIEILADGTWRLYEDIKDTETSLAVQETPIDSVNLDSSDEETIEVKNEPKSDPKLESSKKPENSKDSEISKNPENSKDSEVSKKPKNSKESEISKEPEIMKPTFVDLTSSDDDEIVLKENEAQAADADQPVAVIHLKPQAQIQPQQAVTSSEQNEVIEVDSPSPPTSPTATTLAS